MFRIQNKKKRKIKEFAKKKKKKFQIEISCKNVQESFFKFIIY